MKTSRELIFNLFVSVLFLVVGFALANSQIVNWALFITGLALASITLWHHLKSRAPTLLLLKS